MNEPEALVGIQFRRSNDSVVVGPVFLHFPSPVPLAWQAVTARAPRAKSACFALSGTVDFTTSWFGKRWDWFGWLTRTTSRDFKNYPIAVPLIPSAGSSGSSDLKLANDGIFPYEPAGSGLGAKLTRLQVTRPGNWSSLAVGRNSTLACPQVGHPLNDGTVLRQLLIPHEAVTVVEGTAVVSSCRIMSFEPTINTNPREAELTSSRESP